MRRFPLLFPALIAALLTACAPRETPVEAGIRTRTLLVGNAAEPGDLDPHLASILTDQIIINALFEGLTALDEQTTQPGPAAAESWSVSDDGLTWTFHLRENLRWSNGEPLVASDFITAWQRALSPTFAADNAWYLFPLKNAEAYNAGQITDPAAVGLRAPDDRTLVLTLERPVPYLPALVSLPAWFPLNPRNLEQHDALTQRGRPWTRPGNLVSNGAYQLAVWEPNARIVLDQNPHHRDAATAGLRHIVFFPIEKPDDEERSYRAGQLHVTFNLPVTKLAAWRERAPAQLRVDSLLQSNFIRFNTTRAPLDDPRVRRALSLALDRELLAKSVLQSSRMPAAALTPPHTGGYTAPDAVHADPAAARALLAAAGYPGGAGFPAIDLLVRNDDLMPRLAEAIQAMWKTELGLTTTISQAEQKIWIQNQQTLNYTVCLSAWTADFPDPISFLELFLGDSAYNWTGWNDPAYRGLLDQAAATSDAAARYQLLRQAETLLLDAAPVAPLYYGAQTYLLHPAVKGWAPSPLAFRRFQRVSLAP